MEPSPIRKKALLDVKHYESLLAVLSASSLQRGVVNLLATTSLTDRSPSTHVPQDVSPSLAFESSVLAPTPIITVE